MTHTILRASGTPFMEIPLCPIAPSMKYITWIGLFPLEPSPTSTGTPSHHVQHFEPAKKPYSSHHIKSKYTPFHIHLIAHHSTQPPHGRTTSSVHRFKYLYLEFGIMAKEARALRLTRFALRRVLAIIPL